MGFRMFTTVWELLWYYYSPVCVPHLVGIGFNSIVIARLLLSHCCCCFVFWCGVAFFGGFQHPPADGCSKASCNLGALAGGDEYTPFYSAILNQMQSDFTFTTRYIHNWVLFLRLWLSLFIPSGAIFYSSLIAYLTPTYMGSSSFSVTSFCLFVLFMGFSRQECWNSLPFPSPVDHVLSELSTMTHPSWVALHSMAHSFIELDKDVTHVISLVSLLWLWFLFCLLFDR